MQGHFFLPASHAGSRRRPHPLLVGLAGLAFCVLSPAPLHAQTGGVKTSTATIDVVGGPHAGKHTLQVTDVGCLLSEPSTGPKRFNSNFGNDTKNRQQLSFALVRIRKVTSGPPAPEDFEATFIFGPDHRAGKMYMSGSNAEAQRTGGPGKVLLVTGGKEARITLDLQPEPGVTIKGTVVCSLI